MRGGRNDGKSASPAPCRSGPPGVGGLRSTGSRYPSRSRRATGLGTGPRLGTRTLDHDPTDGEAGSSDPAGAPALRSWEPSRGRTRGSSPVRSMRPRRSADCGADTADPDLEAAQRRCPPMADPAMTPSARGEVTVGWAPPALYPGSRWCPTLHHPQPGASYRPDGTGGREGWWWMPEGRVGMGPLPPSANLRTPRTDAPRYPLAATHSFPPPCADGGTVAAAGLAAAGEWPHRVWQGWPVRVERPAAMCC